MHLFSFVSSHLSYFYSLKPPPGPLSLYLAMIVIGLFMMDSNPKSLGAAQKAYVPGGILAAGGFFAMTLGGLRIMLAGLANVFVLLYQYLAHAGTSSSWQMHLNRTVNSSRPR